MSDLFFSIYPTKEDGGRRLRSILVVWTANLMGNASHTSTVASFRISFTSRSISPTSPSRRPSLHPPDKLRFRNSHKRQCSTGTGAKQSPPLCVRRWGVETRTRGGGPLGGGNSHKRSGEPPREGRERPGGKQPRQLQEQRRRPLNHPPHFVLRANPTTAVSAGGRGGGGGCGCGCCCATVAKIEGIVQQGLHISSGHSRRSPAPWPCATTVASEVQFGFLRL